MSPFLTAEWRHLVMLNYPVDPAVLESRLPPGTELDTWNGQAHVSVVGFRFLNTRLLGIRVPYHRNFDEVNLRFYVRRVVGDEVRRGVVFIKEVVHKWAVVAVARWVYGENYVRARMNSRVIPGTVEYSWHDHAVGAEFSGEPRPLAPGSEPEFIAEHYWGYVKRRRGGAVEYRVEHPSWHYWPADRAWLKLDVEAFYGAEFARALSVEPSSAFVVDGSAVTVYRGRRIP